jgi:hypothetical protein
MVMRRGPDTWATVVNSVSCAAAGTCAAGGFYPGHAFVVSEENGRWGPVVEVPGTKTALKERADAEVMSVSCMAGGVCVAGGYYLDDTRRSRMFVVSSRFGRWGRAIEVPGMATLNIGGRAEVNSVSCVAEGECVAGGFYEDSHWHKQAFVVTGRVAAQSRRR